MKILTLLTLAALSGAGCAQNAPAPAATAPVAPAVAANMEKTKTAKPILIGQTELDRLRANKKAYDEIVRAGTKQLGYEPHPVENLSLDPHYNAQGVNAATAADAGKQLADDALTAYRAGLCYQLTGDKKFAANAQRIADAWANTLKEVTTRQSKFNVSSNMPFLILGVAWAREANDWDSSTYDGWLRRVILPASQSDSKGNHGLWGVLMEASAYAYLNDEAGLTKARDRWNELIRTSVEADGGMPEEYERSGTNNWRGGPDKGIKGLSYTHYALLPASLSAKIFADQGQPVWKTPEGELLEKAFAKSASWTRDPKTFPYYASNNGQLVGVRNAAYFALLQHQYPNADAQAVLNDGEKVGLNGFYLLELFGSDAK